MPYWTKIGKKINKLILPTKGRSLYKLKQYEKTHTNPMGNTDDSFLITSPTKQRKNPTENIKRMPWRYLGFFKS